MPREIKFRAWDKFQKEWMEKPVIDGENGKVMGFNLLDGEYSRIFSDEEVSVIQYTCSKDSEGTEIYEMDVLENSEGKRFLVKWGINSSGFIAKTNESHGNVYSLYHLAPKTKVIGNICENQELFFNV